jgi:hypothetical protein
VKSVKAQFALQMHDHSLGCRIENDGTNYLEFMCWFYQDQFTLIDLAYQVGPFAAQEAEHLEQLCNGLSDPPMRRLTIVPSANFVQVELMEPNFV